MQTLITKGLATCQSLGAQFFHVTRFLWWTPWWLDSIDLKHITVVTLRIFPLVGMNIKPLKPNLLMKHLFRQTNNLTKCIYMIIHEYSFKKHQHHNQRCFVAISFLLMGDFNFQHHRFIGEIPKSIRTYIPGIFGLINKLVSLSISEVRGTAIQKVHSTVPTYWLIWTLY